MQQRLKEMWSDQTDSEMFKLSEKGSRPSQRYSEEAVNSNESSSVKIVTQASTEP